MVTAIELGLLYAIMALGVYLTFRILEFADLTVDGSFATGAAVSAITIVNGVDPILATIAGFVSGMIAGAITGILHTKANIDGLLAGILTQIGLYSINLRIMGAANISLLREDSLLSGLRDAGHLGTGSWTGTLILLPVVVIVLAIIVWFLHTSLGLAMRATGDNPEMIQSFGVSTDVQKILGLSISNGLVALSGSLIAQYQGFADVSMGIGIIVAGLASVIIGQAIIGRLTVPRAATAVVLGAVLYRVVIYLAIEAGLNPNDTKLISAVLVVLALVLPQWSVLKRVPRAFRPKHEDALQNPEILPDDVVAASVAGGSENVVGGGRDGGQTDGASRADGTSRADGVVEKARNKHAEATEH
ncbi:ABC transporter permease [Trueperella bialowiezensis]|uniref:Autoinducer 2 ABC transporter permease LsrC n=1 Tax=Trueperella bialowiezensis TaxID=312285 RepID=A0A3S4VFH5_9ACTO|nr:ABC transporter permease [Trueperella bialowiezensis]VEI12976.1 autoinducer 2 ABC transporter permease LsrC [Trueperella bialowiezensis]